MSLAVVSLRACSHHAPVHADLIYYYYYFFFLKKKNEETLVTIYIGIVKPFNYVIPAKEDKFSLVMWDT